MKFIFDLQRFGGGGTTVTEREPTPDERRITKFQADTAEAYAPNAQWLNNLARELLENSYGAVQADFSNINDTAQKQIADSIQGLTNILDSNNASATNANAKLDEYSDTLRSFGDTVIGKNNEYANDIYNRATSVNNELEKIYNNLGNLMNQHNADYETELKNLKNDTNAIQEQLGTLNGSRDNAEQRITNATDSAAEDNRLALNYLSSNLNDFTNANNAYTSRLVGNLLGSLPEYQNAMTGRIFEQWRFKFCIAL